MELNKLVKNLDQVKIFGNDKIEVESVVIDSRCVTKGSLFICLKGSDYDGHDFISQAEKYGAVAVLTERKLSTALTQVIVKDCRKAMSIVAAAFYGWASKKMKIIGVTGTNGKTTTAHFIASVLNQAGVKCGVIGTLGTFYGEKFIEPTLTTPDPIFLHKIFDEMYQSGYKTVVMEVSAHASYFEKLSGIDFAVGVFTNLTRDHLDFFGNMDEYKKAKLKFFKEANCKYVVTNTDDDFGEYIAESFKNTITYGVDNPADVFAMEITANGKKTNFIINLFDCVYNLSVNLLGKFNVYNVLAAATTCALLGVKTDVIAKGLSTLKNVSGRLECVADKNYRVFIDYAHTPDGLKKVITALKERTDGRLICVFGCGGNRDGGKRYEMGKISGEQADFTIITTDNPRFEEPMDIISQIEKGVLSVTKNYVIVQDRKDAINYALDFAKDNDLILIAGKGCEDYQEILGIKQPFNDKDIVKELIWGKLN